MTEDFSHEQWRAEVKRWIAACAEKDVEIERLKTEVELLTASRREIMKIDEERVAEVERLLSANDKLCKSIIFWRDKAAEIERLTGLLEE